MSSLLTRSLGDVKQQQSGPDRRAAKGGGASDKPYARPVGNTEWKHDLYSTNSAPPSAAPRASSSSSGKKSKKLFLQNLHYEVSERELETLFVQIGPLETLPKINFDRSGRSLGTARLGYTNETDAQKAVEAFDGAMAKGQAIKVLFDYRVEPVVPLPGTLLARLQQDEPQRKSRSLPPPSDAPRAPRNATAPSSRGARGGSTRGAARGGRGGGGAGRGAPRTPATAGDLDKELEDFMSKPGGKDAAPGSDGVMAGKSGADGEGDVEMS